MALLIFTRCRIMLLLLICSSPALFYSQAQKPTPKVMFAIETYAYLKGQSSALKTIAKQFPNLKRKVSAAQNNAEIPFSRAERNIERLLQDELTASEFKIVQRNIDSLINVQLQNQIEKQKYAIDFLEKVSKGTHFITDTMVSKGILSFAYHDTPHEEINDGHIKTFKTKNHPKAEQTALKVPIPHSWLAEEAHMPETIQQFTSYYRTGNEKITIVVYDLSGQPEVILNEKSILEMIPPESALIRTENVKIDGIPDMMVDVEQSLGNADDQMKIRMLQFMFKQKQKLYCLQGSIGPVASNKNLDLQIKKYEPLFRLIASKTVIED
ncbi:hypothetical protein [Flavobacterium johnsoniae]|nr:hypothetical protein [Flavobacterium johnsoniae]